MLASICPDSSSSAVKLVSLAADGQDRPARIAISIPFHLKSENILQLL